jgi:hypothetical protein
VWLRASLPPYLISRILLMAAAVLVLFLVPEEGDRGSTRVLTTWDGEWYLSIAEYGYLPGADVERPAPPPNADMSFDGAVAYFPLYPLIVYSIATVLPFSVASVAIGLSFLSGAAATVAFAKLSSDLTSQTAATRSILLFCFFPGAYILSFAYPEGLLILLGCLCLLMLERGSWLLAGIAAGLASATRPNGLALSVPCAIAAWEAVRRRRDYGSVVAPLLAPLGFLAFLAYLWMRSGDAWYWFRANEQFWHDEIGGWPELRLLLGGSHPQVSTEGGDRWLLIAGLIAGSGFLVFLFVLLYRARLPITVASYAVTYEFLALLNQALAPRPRFIFTAFPLVLALGIWLKDRTFDIVLAVSAGGMMLLFIFYTVPWLQGRFPVAP